jgi:ribosomal protein L11 methyltransferase
MNAWQAGFLMDKAEWLLVEPLLSDVFPALVVKPLREHDPHSPEQVVLIFPEEPEIGTLTHQLEMLFATCGLSAPDIHLEKLPEIDWLQHVYEQLTPIEAGRFFVHGSHIKENIPTDKTAVLIEAAAAFGTGEHPTTKACLLAFDKLLEAKQPRTILDMGCGSGILAIAAAKILPEADILGVDIDPNSVRVAAGHARDNSVDEAIRFEQSDGFSLPLIKKHRPFDLVFANILAQPLIEMAEEMAAVAGGDIILSGFTTEQTAYVEKAYRMQGCAVHDRCVIDDWVALWLTKN